MRKHREPATLAAQTIFCNQLLEFTKAERLGGSTKWSKVMRTAHYLLIAMCKFSPSAAQGFAGTTENSVYSVYNECDSRGQDGGHPA